MMTSNATISDGSIRAVAFDLDGTLYPERAMRLRSAAFFLRNLRFMTFYRQTRLELRRIERIDDFFALQKTLMAERLGIAKDEAHRMIERYIYGEWELILRRVPLYPGARELLERLRAQKTPIGILSDFPLANKLAIYRISDIWNCKIESERVGYLKPRPEPFRALATALEQPPDRILYVGNSYSYDILGAKAVGFRTAHIATKKRTNSEADITFSRYNELSSLLDRLLA